MPDPFPIPSALPNNGIIFDAVFHNVIVLVTFVLGIAALIAIVYSGLMMITSGGDAAKFAIARKNLLWAIIGLIVASLAYYLVSVVYNQFKDSNPRGPQASARVETSLVYNGRSNK